MLPWLLGCTTRCQNLAHTGQTGYLFYAKDMVGTNQYDQYGLGFWHLGLFPATGSCQPNLKKKLGWYVADEK